MLMQIAQAAVLLTSLNAGICLADASEPKAEQGLSTEAAVPFYPDDAVCEARNLRGASYYGRAYGDNAYNRACDYALDACYRDTILKGSCHVVYSGPAQPEPYPQPEPQPTPYPQPNPQPPYPQPAPYPAPGNDHRYCDYRADTSDATACGAPDNTGRQWFCSPRNNWCVIP